MFSSSKLTIFKKSFRTNLNNVRYINAKKKQKIVKIPKSKQIYGSIYDPIVDRLPKPDKDPEIEAKMPTFDYAKINLQKNRLYVFGCTWHGGLGIPNFLMPSKLTHKEMHHISRPVRHSFSEYHVVSDVAAGNGFTLFAAKRKDDPDDFCLFGTGLNTHSQIGYQEAESKVPLQCLISPVPIQLPLRKSMCKVKALGAGAAHSLVAVEGQGLFSFGSNSEGQCGRTVIPDEDYFGSRFIHKVGDFENKTENKVTKIACHSNISYCLTENGRLYSFGSNDRGVLGRDGPFHEPREVGGDLQGEIVTHVVTSGENSIAITKNGEIFGWGSNEIGQLDPYDEDAMCQNLHYPKRINLPSQIGKIVDAAVGSRFSIILNEHGDAYSWGQGLGLGLGPSNLRIKKPSLIPPPLCGRNEFNLDSRIIKVSANVYHASAITNKGDLYMWGKDTHGCLGLGPSFTNKPQTYPLRVTLQGSVVKALLGYDHTFIISKAI